MNDGLRGKSGEERSGSQFVTIMSSFGTLFRVTTFGESHGKGIGAIVENVPPGMALTEADIQPQLDRRKPGQSKITTQVCNMVYHLY